MNIYVSQRIWASKVNNITHPQLRQEVRKRVRHTRRPEDIVVVLADWRHQTGDGRRGDERRLGQEPAGHTWEKSNTVMNSTSEAHIFW